MAHSQCTCQLERSNGAQCSVHTSSPDIPASHGCCSATAAAEADTAGKRESCCGDADEEPRRCSDSRGATCCAEQVTETGRPTLHSGGSAQDGRAVYRIRNMDCPVEENLIRKRLGDVAGIESLEFNLMQRILVVEHRLPSTAPIEDALNAIGMLAEAIHDEPVAQSLFSIGGLCCPTEERLVRGKLETLPGVRDLTFNLVQRTLTIRHDPAVLPGITRALESLDLDSKLMDSDSATGNVAEPATPWGRLLIAGAFAALSEGLELIHEWSAQPFGINPHDWHLGEWNVMEWAPLLFAVLAIVFAGLGTYRKGWIAVRNLDLNINALMSVAVTGAVLIGQYPEAAMVMVLFNLAEAIEAKSFNKARNAMKALLDLTPQRATILNAKGIWEETDIRQIAVGTRVRVRPGERVAMDGVIVEGHSAIDQSPITGESLPVEKGEGDTVFAGTINASGSFEFTVTSLAADSTLARIIHAVEEAQGSRAPMQSLVDRFTRFYTPAIFVTAILIAIIPPLLLGAEWLAWIYNALVVLVIGCPCALVISTPVTIVSGMAAATRHGILVKGGMFLEQGRELRWLALDKTGTLTRGRPQLTDTIPFGAMSANDVLALAYALASRSDHPVSMAVAEAAAAQGTTAQPVTGFEAVLGQGVSGRIGGRDFYLGNRRLMHHVKQAGDLLEKRLIELEKQGKTAIVLADNESVLGIFAVADTLKDSSIEAVRSLHELGIRTVMLTGDNAYAAAHVAGAVGVDQYKAGLLPEEKLAEIERLSESGKVGMVGDGINDAPALARADIGFAMAAIGTDTAIETADVALMDDDLRKIPTFIRLSRDTYRVLLQNITLAIGVKALFFVLTLMGMATMWMAVFADVGTSLLVVANGLRLMRK